MKITAPQNALSLVGKSLGLGLFVFSSLFSVSASTAPKRFADTIWIPVIFYDFHPNKTNDFEMCLNPGGGTRTANNPQGSRPSPDMVLDSISRDRKPIMAAAACISATPAAFPCACGLNDWFRPSGIGTSNSVKFEQYDTTISGNPAKLWHWVGLTKSTTFSTAKDAFWVGPSWDADDDGANLVYYSTLPFVLTDSSSGLYTFDRRRQNTPFFWLDGKGFGNEPGTTHNFAFTMELHHEFTYQGGERFNFSGDDDVWVYINNKLVIDLGGVHNEMNDGFALDTIANEYGLKKNEKYYLDVFYAERHTTESNCLITTNLIRPTIDIFQTISGDTLEAGDTIPIIGIIKDKAQKRMSELEDSIRWEIIPPTVKDSNDRLLVAQGDSTFLTATRAYRFIYVRGWVYDPYVPENIKSDTVAIWVKPGPDHHIVIEATENPRLNDADPLNQITIDSDKNIWEACYSVVRDRFENLSLNKFTSSATVWKSEDTRIATVTAESGKAYHGIVSRSQNFGDTKVIASDGNLIPDDVPVKVSDYYYDRLRLVDLKTGKVVDTLRLETDSTGHYKLQGLKSIAVSDSTNPTSWEDCPGNVALFDTLKNASSNPEFGNTWEYSPINHGKGHVVLSNPNDSRTKKSTIPVIIKLSPPRLKLTILTPENKRIAGDTILVEITIQNTDGLIPVPYCIGGNNPANNDPLVTYIKDSLAYFDNLGRGGVSKPEPYTIVNEKVLLNFDNEKYKTQQCFIGGKDTFGLVLFYAPFEPGKDSLHVLSTYAGSRYAETEPFKLLPGPLTTLRFENSNWVPAPDTVFMNPIDDTYSTYSNGYDEYGNRIGHIPSSEWDVNGDLDTNKLSAKFGPNNTYRTYNERDGMKGDLIAEAVGKNGKIVRADLAIVVRTPPSTIISAFTRDISGNGLLDRVDIVFNKKTSFSLNDGNISIANLSTNTNFPIDSIIPANSGDTLYYIYLHETATKNGQTGWTPTLMLSNFAAAENVSGKTISDGAAPVVWEASVDMKESKDPKKAVVTIKLSERVETGGSQGLVTVESDPADVFKMWEKDGDNFIFEDLLSKIDNFNRISGETFEFTMKNGKEITDRNYVNIFWDDSLIADEKGNYTHERNQKVPLKLIGKFIAVDILPNPSRPTTRIGDPGKLELIDRSRNDAFKLVNENGGAIIRITVLRPSDTTTLKVTIKVYDIAGNQVISAKNDNVFNGHYSSADSSNIVYLHYYWNCTNAKGMKVAPGHYKVIAWFDYSSPKYKDEKVGVEMGVKK
jgi:fibro-slime domain-containing protein